jgi:hypothetical protein
MKAPVFFRQPFADSENCARRGAHNANGTLYSGRVREFSKGSVLRAAICGKAIYHFEAPAKNPDFCWIVEEARFHAVFKINNALP